MFSQHGSRHLGARRRRKQWLVPIGLSPWQLLPPIRSDIVVRPHPQLLKAGYSKSIALGASMICCWRLWWGHHHGVLTGQRPSCRTSSITNVLVLFLSCGQMEPGLNVWLPVRPEPPCSVLMRRRTLQVGFSVCEQNQPELCSHLTHMSKTRTMTYTWNLKKSLPKIWWQRSKFPQCISPTASLLVIDQQWDARIVERTSLDSLDNSTF